MHMTACLHACLCTCLCLCLHTCLHTPGGDAVRYPPAARRSPSACSRDTRCKKTIPVVKKSIRARGESVGFETAFEEAAERNQRMKVLIVVSMHTASNTPARNILEHSIEHSTMECSGTQHRTFQHGMFWNTASNIPARNVLEHSIEHSSTECRGTFHGASTIG